MPDDPDVSADAQPRLLLIGLPEGFVAGDPHAEPDGWVQQAVSPAACVLLHRGTTGQPAAGTSREHSLAALSALQAGATDATTPRDLPLYVAAPPAVEIDLPDRLNLVSSDWTTHEGDRERGAARSEAGDDGARGDRPHRVAAWV